MKMVYSYKSCKFTGFHGVIFEVPISIPDRVNVTNFSIGNVSGLFVRGTVVISNFHNPSALVTYFGIRGMYVTNIFDDLGSSAVVTALGEEVPSSTPGIWETNCVVLCSGWCTGVNSIAWYS